MKNNFDVIIGIENHVELKTKTKMFSPGLVSYDAKPNTMVHAIDMGYPGTMPSVNKKAVELAIRACRALHMSIDDVLTFDRKNYYYPDLPKGYQITQQDRPIGKEGYLVIKDIDNSDYRVEIERLHLEEDTAKQIHLEDKTLLDYNRAGIALIEIVTKPVLHSSYQVQKYLESLRQILIYTDVSDAKMNEGSLRCDINISVRPKGSNKLGSKVEIKNLNSINNAVKAIEFEVDRQITAVLKNQVIEQETRRYDEKTKQTILMRKKTDAIDYRYFTEPNILPIQLENRWLDKILSNMPELPAEKKDRFQKEFGLSEHEIEQIINEKTLTDFFEQTVSHYRNPIAIINYLNGDISYYLNQKGITIDQTKLTPTNLAELILLVDKNIISSKQAKKVLIQILEQDIKPSEIVKKLNIQQITSPEELSVIIEPVIKNNIELLDQYEDRPERVIKFFMGELMKLTKGQASPIVGQEVVEKLIKNIKNNHS